MLSTKEALVKEDQLGALQCAFLIVVSRYLYILGGGIYCTTRGVTSLHANLLCSPCWSGERSHQCCCVVHSTQVVLTSACGVQKQWHIRVTEMMRVKSYKVGTRDVRQRQRVSTAMAALTEREQPLHPFPLQLPLAAVAAAVN